VVFVLVAILICFTSMSRMVEEQRGFIGTAKALGYGQAAIAAKFLLYGALAAIVGCLIGLAIGFTYLPANIFK
jgi:putative ABC transport system permease protein